MTVPSTPSLIDFDHWSTLARSDPEAFEALRTRVIDEAINRAPERSQARLRCLQWKLDQIRDTAASPLSACVLMSRMMWDSVLGDGGLHDTIGKMDQLTTRKPKMPSAQILPFRQTDQILP